MFAFDQQDDEDPLLNTTQFKFDEDEEGETNENQNNKEFVIKSSPRKTPVAPSQKSVTFEDYENDDREMPDEGVFSAQKLKSHGSCPLCGSTSWTHTSLGYLVCENGHQSNEYWQEEAEDLEETQTYVSQKSRRAKVKDPSKSNEKVKKEIISERCDKNVRLDAFFEEIQSTEFIARQFDVQLSDETLTDLKEYMMEACGSSKALFQKFQELKSLGNRIRICTYIQAISFYAYLIWWNSVTENFQLKPALLLLSDFFELTQGIRMKLFGVRGFVNTAYTESLIVSTLNAENKTESGLSGFTDMWRDAAIARSLQIMIVECVPETELGPALNNALAFVRNAKIPIFDSERFPHLLVAAVTVLVIRCCIGIDSIRDESYSLVLDPSRPIRKECLKNWRHHIVYKPRNLARITSHILFDLAGVSRHVQMFSDMYKGKHARSYQRNHSKLSIYDLNSLVPRKLEEKQEENNMAVFPSPFMYPVVLRRSTSAKVKLGTGLTADWTESYAVLLMAATTIILGSISIQSTSVPYGEIAPPLRSLDLKAKDDWYPVLVHMAVEFLIEAIELDVFGRKITPAERRTLQPRIDLSEYFVV